MVLHVLHRVIFVLMLISSLEAKQDSKDKVVNIGDGRNKNWAEKLVSTIKARNDLLPQAQAFADGVSQETIKNLLEPLDALSRKLEGLENLNLNAEQEDGKPEEIKALKDTVLVTKFFNSRKLQSYYTSHGLGFILKKLKQSLPSSGALKGKNLPLNQMCKNVLEDVGEKDKFDISTDKVCKNLNECSGKDEPRPYKDTTGTSLQRVCVKDTNACDVPKAVPVMIALLWYKVSDYIALGFCYNHLKQPQKSLVRRKRREVVRMADFISAYVSTLENWRQFFDDVASQRAFSNLPIAMNLVGEREKSFKFAKLACDKLEASDLCTIGSIFSYYSSLVRIKKDKENPLMTKNLRLHARVDHVRLLELKRESLQHLEALGNIKQLDHNLATLVEGISNYFYELAKYDQGIADQDTVFLETKIRDFQTKSESLSNKVQSDTQEIMIATNVALAMQLVEEVISLTAKIAQHANVIKVIFSGVEVADIYEQAGEVARAAQELVRGAALFATFSSVYNDMAILSSKLQSNQYQIYGLMDMVEAIKENGLKDLDLDSQKFIESYGRYTPKVNRHDLAKNDALWSAYKESTCDLLFGAQGFSAGVTQGAVGGMLLCEKLEGSLAEFFTLRENIFDFQFDLVDSIASVVRGNIAKKLAKDIDVKNDHLKPDALMMVFFMTQFRLQFEASLYCNKWEYINQGKTIPPCNTNDFIDAQQLEDLLSYDYGTLYHEAERFVYIPTKPQFPGDTGFINFASLAKGNSVIFRIPANRTWLQKFNWLSSGESLAPFVASFKLYLPLQFYHNDDEKKREYTKTNMEIVSSAGSRVDENSQVVYNIPMEHSIYKTIYEEGYDSAKCPRGKEIMNPYSMCDNLPLICDTMTRVPGSLVMPTILSTWNVAYSVQSGHCMKKWDAPRPATDLFLVAKVKLRFLPGNGRKRSLGDFEGEPVYGCCAVKNTYRPMWNKKQCVSCPTKPTKSKARLRGYYCEKGNEPIAQTIPDNYYVSKAKKSQG